MNDRSIPLNRDSAYNTMISTPDPITRRLMNFALAQATICFLRPEGQGDDEYYKKLPAEPFDMMFFAKIMQNIFSNQRLLKDILNGKINEEDFF